MGIDDIKRTLAAHRPELARRFNVSEIGVFGSYARGEQGAGSDVDLLVSFKEPVGLFAFMDLEEYLEGILGRHVDLVTRKALKPGIGRNVLRDLVTI